MKKQVMIVGIIIILLLLGLSGCETEQEGAKTEIGDDNQLNGDQSSEGKIAFESNKDIYLMNPDGTGISILTEGSYPLVWSPDGSKITYCVRTTMASIDYLYVINADGTNSVFLGNTSFSPCWSPDGEKILFGLFNDKNGIFLANADGSNVINLEECYIRSAVFSPDGQKIAWIGNNTEMGRDAAELYLMNPDGTGKTKLLEDTIYIRYSPYAGLSWSPDGTKITYQDGGSLIVINADGTNKFVIDSSGNDPAWSPDSSRLAYWNYFDDGLYVANPDGTGKKLLSTSGGPPSWSPDGQKIVFGDSSGDIYLVNSDGSGLTKIYNGYFPRWSPS